MRFSDWPISDTCFITPPPPPVNRAKPPPNNALNRDNNVASRCWSASFKSITDPYTAITNASWNSCTRSSGVKNVRRSFCVSRATCLSSGFAQYTSVPKSARSAIRTWSRSEKNGPRSAEAWRNTRDFSDPAAAAASNSGYSTVSGKYSENSVTGRSVGMRCRSARSLARRRIASGDRCSTCRGACRAHRAPPMPDTRPVTISPTAMGASSCSQITRPGEPPESLLAVWNNASICSKAVRPESAAATSPTATMLRRGYSWRSAR